MKDEVGESFSTNMPRAVGSKRQGLPVASFLYPSKPCYKPNICFFECYAKTLQQINEKGSFGLLKTAARMSEAVVKVLLGTMDCCELRKTLSMWPWSKGLSLKY